MYVFVRKKKINIIITIRHTGCYCAACLLSVDPSIIARSLSLISGHCTWWNLCSLYVDMTILMLMIFIFLINCNYLCSKSILPHFFLLALYLKKNYISYLFTHWGIITPILERDLKTTLRKENLLSLSFILLKRGKEPTNNKSTPKNKLVQSAQILSRGFWSFYKSTHMNIE